jgi:hypothetical protein
MYKFVLFFSILYVTAGHSQQGPSCNPNTKEKARYGQPLNKGLPYCYPSSLLAENEQLTILGYKVYATGPSFGDDGRDCENQGTKITSCVQFILMKARKGDTVTFDCIRAANKNGVIFILQPLIIQL